MSNFSIPFDVVAQAMATLVALLLFFCEEIKLDWNLSLALVLTKLKYGKLVLVDLISYHTTQLTPHQAAMGGSREGAGLGLQTHQQTRGTALVQLRKGLKQLSYIIQDMR